MPRAALAALLALLLQDPPKTADLAVLTDAWPRKERAIGQRFGMNARDSIPVAEIGGEPDDIESDAVGKISTRRARYRIVSVTVKNTGDQPLDGALLFPKLSQRREVRVPPRDWARLFHVVQERKGLESLKVELRDSRGTLLAEAEPALKPARVGAKTEADIVAWELQQEQKMRGKFPRLPATVEVRDANGRGIAGAKLTLLHEKLGQIVEAAADAKGDWSGALLAGGWKVFARAQVDPPPPKTPTEPAGSTVAEQRLGPDLYYLAGELKLGDSTRSIRLVTQRSGAFVPLDEDGKPALPDKLALWPTAFADPLRYEPIHAAVGDAFILRGDLSKATGPVTIHTSEGFSLDLLSWCSAAGARRASLVSASKIILDRELRLQASKEYGGVIALDPSKLAGCAKLEAVVSLPDRPRERYAMSAATATQVVVPAGALRMALKATMLNGSVLHLTPHVHEIAAGRGHDLTPRDFDASVHFQDTRGLMVWIAITDEQGRAVTRIENPKGEIAATAAGKPLFKRDLASLTLHFPTEFAKVPLAGIHYTVKVDLGPKPVKFDGKAKPRRQFADPPAAVVVPDPLEERARAILPMIKKTLAGSIKTFDIKAFDLTIYFEIRLPPEVGGMGGGGAILLDLGEILEYAHETDRLPGAYTHELGHCLGFGHDPYMTMAPCGVDEGLLGPLGYWLLNARVPNRTLAYLDRDKDEGEWQPDGGVYAAMRMIYGADVHAKMFNERRRNEARLAKAGFSIAEQQAAYYATVIGESPAWLFRAYGWPVFDYRVMWAQILMRNQGMASAEKLPKKIDGSYLTTWWMRGPIPMGGDAPKDLPPWKIHQWDGRFVHLATEEDFLKDTGFHFFLTVRVPEARTILLSIGSDCQVSFFLNGKRVSRVLAAPQFTQPVHDGYTMERGNATIIPVDLMTGDNELEMTVVKPSGSKGLFLEFAGGDGRPIRDGGYDIQRGPDEMTERDAGERVRHSIMPPVYNPGFELMAGALPHSWLRGAKDGDGELRVSVDDQVVHSGKRSLKLVADGSMSSCVLQRIVVEEKANYEFTGWIHTDGFRAGRIDRAWVMLFLGDASADDGVVRTEVIHANQRGWTKLTFKWEATRREIYIGCVLRGGGGASAWFDSLSLVKTK